MEQITTSPTTPSGGYARRVLRHWEEHNPSLVAQLRRLGRLERALGAIEERILTDLRSEMEHVRAGLRDVPYLERARREEELLLFREREILEKHLLQDYDETHYA